MAQSSVRPATKARPCPVCEGDHKCSTTADGLILCGRNDGSVPGFRHLGPTKDPTWLPGENDVGGTFVHRGEKEVVGKLDATREAILAILADGVARTRKELWKSFRRNCG